MAWAFCAGPLNITVQEDEFRMAIFGRVASFALVGREITCRLTPAGEVGIVILIGSRTCQGG
jgi:hypothetical protein